VPVKTHFARRGRRLILTAPRTSGRKPTAAREDQSPIQRQPPDRGRARFLSEGPSSTAIFEVSKPDVCDNRHPAWPPHFVPQISGDAYLLIEGSFLPSLDRALRPFLVRRAAVPWRSSGHKLLSEKKVKTCRPIRGPVVAKVPNHPEHAPVGLE
jgi:hypothetical protein